MASTYQDAGIKLPWTSVPDTEWLLELEEVEKAVAALLVAKRSTLRENPVREQVLWIRYAARLKAVKRQLDAAAF